MITLFISPQNTLTERTKQYIQLSQFPYSTELKSIPITSILRTVRISLHAQSSLVPGQLEKSSFTPNVFNESFILWNQAWAKEIQQIKCFEILSKLRKTANPMRRKNSFQVLPPSWEQVATVWNDLGRYLQHPLLSFQFSSVFLSYYHGVISHLTVLIASLLCW